MLRIGEFAKLSKVTIKALRYYEKEGLLVPKHVDKFNSYRYYDNEQLKEIAKIISLKQYGLKIDEIKKIIINNENLNELLKNRKKELEETILKYNNQLSKINYILEEKKMAKEIKMGDIFYINVKNLGSFGYEKSKSMYGNKSVEFITVYANDNTSKYLENDILEDDIFIEIKYIGNGLFEESITKEKIFSNMNELSFDLETSNILDIKIMDYNFDDFIYLNYEDYKTEHQKDSSQLSKDEYIKSLENNIKILSNYPLSFNSFRYDFPLLKNEESMKKYLKYDNETKKQIIIEAKKRAIADTKKVIPLIENAIKNN